MRTTPLLLALFALALAPSSALAWHTGSSFDELPGAGGGGGLFYTGSSRDRGWTCAACHVDPPGDIRVSIAAEGLFVGAAYEPGRTYDIVVEITEELRGLAAGRSNFNGVAAMATAPDGSPAGRFSFEPGEFHARGTAIVASTGRATAQTRWALRWTAPELDDRTVTFSIGVVDGDGAGSAPDETRTDPFGDDVAMGRFEVAGPGSVRAQRTGDGPPQPIPGAPPPHHPHDVARLTPGRRVLPA